MKISINPRIKGKAKTDEERRLLTDGWINLDESAEDIYELITTDGYPTTAYMTCDYRKEDNFVSRQLLMIDIDNGMSLPELFDNDFYNNCGFGFYASPSYTDEKPKFRILFVSENPFTNVQEYRNFMTGMVNMFPHADKACIDGCRIFFGTPNCMLKELRGKHIPQDVVQQIIKDGTHVPIHYDSGIDREVTDLERYQVLEHLYDLPTPNQLDWAKIGWNMRCAGYDEDDFIRLSLRWMPNDKIATIKNVWKNARYGSINFLRKYIKQNGDRNEY